MAKKSKRDENVDPRDKLLASLNLKNLKRACIVRGMPHMEVVISDFSQLQSWLFYHFNDPMDSTRLEEFDKWYEAELQDQGVIDGELHVDLKFGYYVYDDEGNRRDKKRNTLIVGLVKSDKEKASFKPKKGTKKELAFELFSQGLSTNEVIERVVLEYPDISEGSIKVWGTQFRKRQKLIEKMG